MSTCLTSPALEAASRNWAANALALKKWNLPVPAVRLAADCEIVRGRDGALTAQIGGKWHRGCSVPHAAAEAQLRQLAVNGPCACLLNPMHAAAVGVVLSKMRYEQSLIVVLPDPADASLLLQCADFNADITAGRLWLCFGGDWSSHLRRIFNEAAGLAIPTQFIRTQDADIAATDLMIDSAQQLFSEVATARKHELEHISDETPVSNNSICVVGGMRFKLWADAAAALLSTLSVGGRAVTVFDTDSPLSASHVALARASAGCCAVVAVDLYRSDSGPAARTHVPWITWVTQPRVQPFAQAQPIDGLMLADPQFAPIAAQAGWPLARTVVAQWPRSSWRQPLRGPLSVIANIPPLAAPAELEHFSSLRVLWDQLAAQISQNPFAAFDRAEELVHTAASALNIDATSVNTAQFVEQLICPAYAVAVTRLLVQAGLPLSIFGSGWESFSFARHLWRSAVDSRDSLVNAIGAAGALVHVWPTSRRHPIEFAGPPAIKYAGGGTASWVAAARNIGSARQALEYDSISLQLIERLLHY